MKTIICDIDGVLNYYPETILNFASSLGYPKCKTLYELKTRLSFVEYNELKKKYRQSVYKHEATIRTDAKELLSYFSTHDFFIILLTARECSDDMVQKTCQWLRKNNLNFDYIYFSAKKDLQKFKTTEVIIDDSINNLRQIHNIKPNARFYLVNGSDNMLYEDEPYIIRVNTLDEIIKSEEAYYENSNQCG